MRSTGKMAVVAGLLGSVALVGLGATHAYADDPDPTCKGDKSGSSCRNVEYHRTTYDGRTVTVVNRQSLTCRQGGNYIDSPDNEADGSDETTQVTGTTCNQTGRHYNW